MATEMTSHKPVYVWEAPVRLWHWVMALAMVVLAVTGYFIGSPLPSTPGEASDYYLLGYIRFVAPLPQSDFLVMGTYWLAQSLIAFSFLKREPSLRNAPPNQWTARA